MVLLLCALASPAAGEPALLAVETRVSRGLAVGGGAGTSTVRLSPYDIGALVEWAVRTHPWTSVYGGAFLESDQRAGLGARGGFRLLSADGRYRVALGGVALLAPYTAYGLEAGAGRCWRIEHGFAGCADLLVTAFAGGDDVPAGRVAAKIQLAGGVRFDAW